MWHIVAEYQRGRQAGRWARENIAHIVDRRLPEGSGAPSIGDTLAHLPAWSVGYQRAYIGR